LTRIDKKRLSAANTRGGGPGVQHTSQAGQNHRHDWRNTLQHSDNNTTTARATQQQADNDGEEDVTLHRCTANASTFFFEKTYLRSKACQKDCERAGGQTDPVKDFHQKFFVSAFASSKALPPSCSSGNKGSSKFTHATQSRRRRPRAEAESKHFVQQINFY